MSPSVVALAPAVPEIRLLLEAARRIAEDLAETASARDQSALLPTEEIARIATARIGAARIPIAYGGAGGSFADLAEIVMVLAAGDPSVAQSLQPHFIFLERVRLLGTEEQRQRYLGLAASGTIFGNAITEKGVPKAGDIATVLTETPSGYRLRGRKFYTTGTSVADYTFVAAIADDGSRVMVAVPTDREGVRTVNDWDAMGQRATASGTTLFQDVAIEPDEIFPLGALERRHHTGSGSQVIHCAIDAGIGRAALRDTITYARHGARPHRDSGMTHVTEDPYVQRTVGEIATQVHGAEAMVLRAAGLIDRAAEAVYGGALTEDQLEPLLIAASIATAEAKIASTGAALRASEALYEIGGASATSRSLNLDRHWRNARTHTTHDPLPYKYKAIGDFLLNDRPPPNSLTF